MKQLRLVLVTIVILSLCGTSILSAQETGTALVRFGDFRSQEEAGEMVELYWQSLLRDVNFSSNVLTPYMPAEVGEQTFSFAPEGEGATADILPATETVTIQEGHVYTIVLTSLDQPPYIVDETGVHNSDSDSSLRIMGAGFSGLPIEFSFDPLVAAPVGTDGGLDEEYLFAFGDWGRIEFGVGNTQTQEVINSFPLLILPNTHVMFNGSDPSYVNYSTPLSVADWLAQISQMENPPFTFNHFLETANTGGFYAALQQCEDYMWNVFTDGAFEALTSEQQAYVRGQGAATVMDDSVLEAALTTTPWLNAPATTRGGLPISFVAPIQLSANNTATVPAGNAVTGNVLLTITTTGNDVQNILNLLDTLPVGDEDVRPSRVEYRFFSDIDEAFLGG